MKPRITNTTYPRWMIAIISASNRGHMIDFYVI
jgi:hypothetical protein